jgi:hypothetical protein
MHGPTDPARSLTDGGERGVEGEVEVDERHQARRAVGDVPPAHHQHEASVPPRSLFLQLACSRRGMQEHLLAPTHRATYWLLSAMYLWNTCDHHQGHRRPLEPRSPTRPNAGRHGGMTAHLIVHGEVIKVLLERLPEEARGGHRMLNAACAAGDSSTRLILNASPPLGLMLGEIEQLSALLAQRCGAK